MLIPVTPPAPVVSLEDAKKHLRLEHDDDDAYIEALVATATAAIDGAGGWLGRAIGVQTWDLVLPAGWAWSAHHGWHLRLPLPPLVEVLSITYRDSGGAAQILETSAYTVHGIGATGGGYVALANGATWPAMYAGLDAVTIRFRAGYETVPAPIRQAILLMVGRLYHGRGEPLPGNMVEDRAAQDLLNPYRVWS